MYCHHVPGGVGGRAPPAPLPSIGRTAMKFLTIWSVTAALASWWSFVIWVRIPIRIFFTSPVSILPAAYSSPGERTFFFNQADV